MNPSQLKQILNSHFKTYQEAANYLGVSRRSIFYYLAGRMPIPKPLTIILKFLEKAKPSSTLEKDDTSPNVEE